MTNQREISKDQIQTAFRDVGLRVPTDVEMDESQAFVDSYLDVPVDSITKGVWSPALESSVDALLDLAVRMNSSPRWVEDMLIPPDIELGALIEEQES